MDDSLKTILTDLRAGLESLYGPRLKGLYLFGSRARGDEEDESDVDVLIVLDAVEDYSGEIARTSEVVSAVSLNHGKTVSRVFTSEDRWRRDTSLFYQNLREEAVPA